MATINSHHRFAASPNAPRLAPCAEGQRGNDSAAIAG